MAEAEVAKISKKERMKEYLKGWSPYRYNVITSYSIHYTKLYDVLIENIDRASKLLKSFQEKGIQISIDDFGTGYSSLNYLKRLPIDNLKIDQSFIRNIQNSKNDKIIVNTIIAMAHALEFSVIAEGVEDSYQKDYLKEMNCDILQGYYFGKPLGAAEFEALV